MNSYKKYKIGIVGVGVLGSAIAKCIINQKITLYGFDISKKFIKNFDKNYFKFCSSLDELFKKTDIVISCLPNEQSLLEISYKTPPKTFILETSTLPLECKTTARKNILKNGANIVDCPVSGNRLAALEGQLSSYLSGTKKDKKIANVILNLFCKKITDVGPFGNGIVMKLIGNILNLVHNAVTAEVMILGMKSGLSPNIIHKAICGTFSSSSVFENRGKLMVNEDYSKEGMNFSVPLKDSAYITNLSREKSVGIPIYQVALQYYYSAVAHGLKDNDASSILKIMEKNSNFKRPG
jgi:3-hydroxyisobutyrate dehydrogenase-like beta-hydroxyacid dehydrogenase